MMIFLKILLVIGSLACVIEDLEYRAIHWLIFPLLFVIQCGINYKEGILHASLVQWMVNVCFILFQFGLITIYFSVKEKRVVYIFSRYIGWGDILFLLVISIAFDVTNFMWYYVASLFLSLLSFGLIALYKKDPVYQVPLAGIQAALFLCLFVVNNFYDRDIFRNGDVTNIFQLLR